MFSFNSLCRKASQSLREFLLNVFNKSKTIQSRTIPVPRQFSQAAGLSQSLRCEGQ